MNNKLSIILGSIAYILSFILIIYYLIIEFSIIDVYHPLYRLTTIFVIIIFMYIGGLLLKKSSENLLSKAYKLNLYSWFFLFLIMILNLTLFDKYFNRHMLINKTGLDEYIKYSFNIKPFHTISNYILALKNHNLTNTNFNYNIFGNILAFIPLSLFLPHIIKKANKWYIFFGITSLFIIFIEILQMLTRSGSCDIDDYILNILGAMIFYFIFNNKFIKTKIDKYIFMKEGE